MFFEDTGSALIDEIKEKELKKYNSKHIFALKSEIKSVDNKIEEIKHLASTMDDVTEELSVNFALLKAYKDRLLRISAAYHYYRFIKIQDSYFYKENTKQNLSLDEIELLNEFSNLADGYLKSYKHLNLSDRNPPLDFYVQILTLEDCGAVMSGNDFVDLKKDRIYFLKKSDISHLLKKSMVKII